MPELGHGLGWVFPGSGNQFAISSSGVVTNSAQPAFSAYVNATQSNVTGDNTSYDITGAFWTENFDNNSDFSNGVFTAPVTGKYLFSGLIFITGLTSHTNYYLSLVTTGGTYYPIGINPANIIISSGCYLSYVTPLIQLSATNTAYLNLRVAGATKVVSIPVNSTTETTFFSGALIC